METKTELNTKPIIRKMIQLLFLFPIFFAIGFFLSSLLPNQTSTSIYKIVRWLPFILIGILTFTRKLSILFLSRRNALWATLSFLFAIIPLSLFAMLASHVWLGERVMDFKSPFLEEVDLSGGRDYSILQGRDAASFGSGTKYKWGETGKQTPHDCENSEEYSAVKCSSYQLPASDKCFSCSFLAPTQDTYYSLIYISGSRLTEFYSVNHDFNQEPPKSLGKYFYLPPILLSKQ